jgi:hypothetical protein
MSTEHLQCSIRNFMQSMWPRLAAQCKAFRKLKENFSENGIFLKQNRKTPYFVLGTTLDF